VEVHPYLQNKVLARHCAGSGIPLTAYIPIARGEVDSDPVMRSMAERHGVTPAQVALAFLMARGHIVIPKSANPERQRQNLAATSLRLTQQEMAEIDALDRGHRLVDPEDGPAWD
jgi:2,5-diketo-D-gluconate reductase B